MGGAAHHVEGGRLRVGRIDVALEAEAGRGEGEHTAELAAAEDADRAVGPERRAG